MENKLQLLWEHNVPKKKFCLTSISKDGELLAIICGNILKLFTKKGDLLWKYKLKINLIENIFKLPSSISLSKNGDYITVASWGRIYLFDISGKLLWTKSPIKSKMFRVISKITPVLKSQFIYEDLIASISDILCVFTKEGDKLIEYPLKGGATALAFSSKGKYIVVGSSTRGNKMVHYLDEGGNLIWNSQLPSIPVSISMLETGNYVLVGTEKEGILFFDNHGKELWSNRSINLDLDTAAISPDGSYMIVGSTDENLYCFSDSGELIWKKYMEETISNINMVGNIGIHVINTPNKLTLLNKNGNKICDYESKGVISSVSVSSNGYLGVCSGSLTKNGSISLLKIHK